MKGLLIKDIRLLMNQKKFFLIVMLCGFMFLFSNDTPEGAMGYITILSSMLVLTSMSYDEFEKGMSFLMTLPITKVTYVWEKYVLGGIIGTVMSIFTTVVAMVVFQAREISYPIDMFIYSGILFWGLSFLFLGIMIPVQLKFGSEKGKFAKMIAMVVVAFVAFGIVKLLELVGVDVIGMMESLMNSSIILGFGIICLVCITFYVFSGVVSCRILSKKEL